MSFGDWRRDGRMSDTDEEGITDFLNEIRDAVDALLTDPGAEALQQRVCLAVRAAFTEFYTIAVIDSCHDGEVGTQLGTLIGKAMKALPEGKYRQSVANRSDELDRFLAAVQSPTDTAV